MGVVSIGGKRGENINENSRRKTSARKARMRASALLANNVYAVAIGENIRSIVAAAEEKWRSGNNAA